MKTIKTILLAGVLIPFLSCTTTETKDVSHKEDSASTAATEMDIELNNGEKWKVNEQMLPFIKASEQLLADFQKDSNNDFKKLATDLKSNNNELIASCTMTGKSHDVLHQWLHPHLGLVQALEQAESEADAKEMVEKLKHSFQLFNTFFQ